MIDKDLIEAKFDIIERNLHFIRSYYGGKIAEEDHIIAAERFERAEEYSQMFIILAKNGVISANLAKKLSNMARFRNLLVHRYGEVKVKRLLEIVKVDLDDVVEFVKEIKKFIGI